jgi:hypothetical protein
MSLARVTTSWIGALPGGGGGGGGASAYADVVTLSLLLCRMLKNDPNGNHYFNLVLNSQGAAVANKHVPLYTNKGLLTRHDSLAGLASQLHLPSEVLQETFSAYLQSSAVGCVAVHALFLLFSVSVDATAARARLRCAVATPLGRRIFPTQTSATGPIL